MSWKTRTAMVIVSATTMIGCSLLVSVDGFSGPSDASTESDASTSDAAVDDALGDAADDTTGGDDAADGSVDLLSCNAPGLVAYYKFDESSGTLAVNCVGTAAYAGQVNGAIWTTPIEGANALKFDGNDRVDFASSIPLLEDVTTRNFTVSASVVASAATLTKLGRIVSKCNAIANGCNDGLELLVEDRAGGGTPGLALRVPTVNTLSDKIQDPAPFPLDVTVRVAGVYDATTTPTGRVYRDGDKVAEGPLAGTRRNTGGPVKTGMKADLSGACGFVGTIDEVRIWNRALSDCEVRTLAGKACP